ncbi:MAG: prolipoprotein diacylglyceryl transferase [Planctomycetaceae bacterium]|nr:prolipoprotein diacylglyceryl transferase [Planctomycetaceae bacterium]
MRQTLFRIPLDGHWSLGPLGDVPGFGFGVALLFWVLLGALATWKISRANGSWKQQIPNLSTWVIVAAIILLMPTIAAKIPNLPPDKSIPVYGYGFMMFLGFLAGGWFATQRAKVIGLEGEAIWDLAMWIFFAGIGGARAFYVIQKHDVVFRGREGIMDHLFAIVNLPDGGLVFYGGMILASLAYIAFCYRRKINPLLLGDAIVPSIFIGMAFGRLGCLLNGCCYGDRCELPWAITFPKGSVPYSVLVNRGFLDPAALASLPLHPTQIYSSINALILAVLTAIYFRYRPRNGAVVALALVLYPITRATIELLRGDELGQFGTSLTIAQWVSLGIFVTGLALWAWIVRGEGCVGADGPLTSS